MFFGGRRKKATEAATAALRPVIATAQISGMSTHMYYDPYVLGYLSFMASFFAKAETNNRVKSSDLGFAMQDAFTNVCNVNGAEMTRNVIELVQSQDPDFLRGSDDASVACYYTVGLMSDSADVQLLRDAQKFADAVGGSLIGGDRRSAVGGAIMQLTFNNRIRELRGEVGNA